MPIILLFVLVIGAFLAGNSIVNHQIKPAVTEETKIETPSSSPSLTPTPTPVPQVKRSQIAPTPYDPIVECGTDWQRSRGLMTRIQKSICDSWVLCQVGDKSAMLPKEKCPQPPKANGDMVRCNLSFGDFGILTKDQCQKLVNDQVNKELQQKSLQQMDQYIKDQGL